MNILCGQGIRNEAKTGDNQYRKENIPDICLEGAGPVEMGVFSKRNSGI
jgi:hypothetical protein